jgi:hypothetical protein
VLAPSRHWRVRCRIRTSVAGVYNRALYTVPKTQAMAAWAERLMAIVEGREPAGNVAPIAAGRAF